MKISEDDFNEALRRFTTLSNDMTRRSILRAAVEAIPEPASHADALPVPGAAVRALVEELAGVDTDDYRLGEVMLVRGIAQRLRAALAADGLASQALPSRDEIAASLRAAKFGGEEVPAPYSEIDQRVRDNWLRAADKAIELLARRPADDEVEAWRRAVERPLGCDDDESHTPEWAEDVLIERCQELADLESQLASVTGERDLAAFDKETAHRERDEALAKLASVTEDRDNVESAHNKLADELKEARGQLSARQAQLADARTKVSGRDAIIVDQNKQLASLREQLAARPEPVVIDEALTEAFIAAYPGLPKPWSAPVFAALRKVFGDRASVSVPPGDPYAGIANEDLTDEQLAEASRSSDERLIARLNADLAYSRKTLDGVLEQRDQLRADLEKTRAELAETHKTWQRINDRHVDEKHALREQHEALRAACVITPAERAAMSFWPNQHSKECAQLETLQSYACRVERAMLKPAPAQYHPNDLDDVDGDVSQLDPLMESVSPADALRPNDRHGMVGATAAEQVLRHASEPDCEPIADWVAKRGLPGVPASLQQLTARVERLERDNALVWRFVERGAYWLDLYDAAREALDARKGADRG